MCQYWWRWYGDRTPHRCKNREHAIGTSHNCECGDSVTKVANELGGEQR